MLIERLKVGAFGVFCYVLGCEETREGVVIDPGDDAEEILKRIRELGLTIRYILATHFHPDHTAAMAPLKAATGAETLMHAADNAMLTDPEAIAHFGREGFTMSGSAERAVEDGDRLTVGKLALRIIHTPGHSPGSICILCEGNLFTGDSLFVGAAGRVDVPGGDFATLTASLEAKVATLPPETVVWPGHDYGETPTSTIGREKEENPYLGGEW